MVGGDDEEHPGEPWGYYVVKDREHGYKWLECSKVGHVSDIRSKDCKTPKPVDSTSMPSSSTSVPHPNAAGASAAVVGEKLLHMGQLFSVKRVTMS